MLKSSKNAKFILNLDDFCINLDDFAILEC